MSKKSYTPKYTANKQKGNVRLGDFQKLKSIVEFLPIEQRLDVEKKFNERKGNPKKPTKRQGIINAIFDGLDIGEICFYKLSDEEKETYIKNYDFEYVKDYAVHDGGHRSRAIIAFMDDKFPTTAHCGLGKAKYFSELTPEEREYWDNYEIRTLTYTDASPEFRGRQFHQASKNTELNHQEVLNGYGNIPVGNAIRDMARRLDAAMIDNSHAIFETVMKKGVLGGYYLKSAPTRLTYDRLVARIMCIELSGGVAAACDDEEIEAMYQSKQYTEDQIAKAKTKTKECLDFMFQVVKHNKNETGGRKATIEELIMLMRLYYTFRKDGEIKVKELDSFARSFSKAYNKFHKNGPAYVHTILPTGKILWDEFQSYLRKHKDVKYWNSTIEWFNHEFKYEKLIESGVLRRTKSQGARVAGQDVRLRKWEEQDRRCGFTGKKLAFKDAVAAHIIAHTKGGTDDYNNFVVVHKNINTEMGTLSFTEYQLAKGVK